jgi:anti-anti-sigma factor
MCKVWDLRVTVEKRDGFAILSLAGRISARTSNRLEEALGACKGVETLLIDLSGVDYLSGKGLAFLSVASARTRLVLCAPSGPVQIVLELAGLCPGVPVEPSLGAALARLVPSEAPPTQDLADEPAQSR